MGTVLGAIGLTVAFAAVWLASQALRKIDEQNEEFIRAHVNTLMAAIQKNKAGVRTLADHVHPLIAEVESIKNMSSALPDLREEVRELREDMSRISRPTSPDPSTLHPVG